MSIIDKIFSFGNKEIKPIDYVLVGLGNPGAKYINTRHNVGFMTIDKMCSKYGVDLNINKFESKCGEAIIADKKVLLVQPQTYMNESGIAVQKIISFYKIPISNVIVVFDDISLNTGNIRIKRSGSHGGHNGIKSIINCCASESFPRIKVGVGNKPNPEWDLADWVLSKFSGEDMEKVQSAIDNAVKSFEVILESNIETAMNKFN